MLIKRTLKRLAWAVAVGFMIVRSAWGAVDTVPRRATACGLVDLVAPDATIDAGDRASLAGVYSGMFDGGGGGAATTGATTGRGHVFVIIKRNRE